jgi:hypothetical protein
MPPVIKETLKYENMGSLNRKRKILPKTMPK